MNHIEVLERLEQNTSSASIEEFIWVAASLDSRSLVEFVEDLYEEDWENIFPGSTKSDFFQSYYDEGEMVDWLRNNHKWGFLAKVHFPHCSNFSYDDKGEPVRWRVNAGICRLERFYAEDLMGLIEQIEAKSKEIFDEELKKEREQKETQ